MIPDEIIPMTPKVYIILRTVVNNSVAIQMSHVLPTDEGKGQSSMSCGRTLPVINVYCR